ncbi:MAG: phage terminase large subunit [Firmicutes bacterium]|nr:phage terminase large subunit [Bacillota bacterium]
MMLADKLMDLACGRIHRLMVFIPPRHGKSFLCSRLFPAWYLINNPDKRVILCSYGASLALNFSRRAREIVREYGPWLSGINLAGDSKAADQWGIKGHEGGLIAAGVGGPITGHGGNIVLIDDVIKNIAEADSQTYREAIWEWYASTLRTRLEPQAGLAIIMTRWRHNDLAGQLLDEMESGGERYEILKFPALAEEGDPLGRIPGEPLWPERYGKEELEALRASQGSYLFSAIYQQTPRRAEGNMFRREWFRYFRDEDDFYVLLKPSGEHRVKKADCWFFQTVDPAATEKETSDYFACGSWIVTPEADLLLYDMFRERLETPKHKMLLRAMYERYRPALQGVEEKTFGLSLLQEARLEGLPVIPLKADTDKVSRAYPIAARYEAGTVYHRVSTSWLQVYEDELEDFPRGEHDDMVDCASYAAIVLAADRARRQQRQGIGRVAVIG